MAQDSIRVSAVFPTTPQDLYAAWLDSERHGAFTGLTATVESHIGGRHTAWDGYIEGEILELEPNRRILQSWRSLDFPADAPNSRLEVLLHSTSDGGVEMTLVHSEIPEGQGSDYEEGWFEYYFKPMQRYFRGEPPLVPEPMQQHAPAKKKHVPVKAKPKAKRAAPAKKKAAHRRRRRRRRRQAAKKAAPCEGEAEEEAAPRRRKPRRRRRQRRRKPRRRKLPSA